MNLQTPHTVALLGYGVSHKGLLKYLQDNSVWTIDLYDDRDLSGEVDDVRAIYQGLDLQDSYDYVFKTPGIHVTKVSVPEGTILTNDTDLFLHLTSATVIGVTGTKGKSTTASLIYHILKESGYDAALAGNIGNSIFEKPEDLSRDYVVYEMSSFQCDQLTKNPHIAVLTNIYRAHTIEHGGHEHYVNAKKNITAHQGPEDYFVTTVCDIQTHARVVCAETDIKEHIETAMIGEHNQINIALALHVAEIIGISREEAVRHVATYKPLPGRIEKVAERESIEFYDDALGTVPEATGFTIKALPVTTLITGGADLGFDYTELREIIQKSDIKKVIYFKDTGKEIVEGLEGIEIIEAHSMKQAVEEAFKAGPGICVLSSASPSFSMFENYKDRSAQYKLAIEDY